MATLSTSSILTGGLSRLGSKSGGHQELSASSSLAFAGIGGTPLTAAGSCLPASKSLPLKRIVCKNSSATQTAVPQSASGTLLPRAGNLFLATFASYALWEMSTHLRLHVVMTLLVLKLRTCGSRGLAHFAMSSVFVVVQTKFLSQ
jgi:hypothetical protein